MAILLPEERLGQRVAGRYRLDAILSAGGMGVLFEGLDEATHRPVAVKMLKPAYALEPGWVARFLRETRIAVRLRHPNIATVLDVWTDESGTPFLIMELLQGRSLAKELEARGTLPIGEALAIAVPVGQALAAAHAIGVIHRDIKPGNIFLCRDFCGEAGAESLEAVMPKLLDFGIAKSARDDFETETGMLVGTPGYMAPERVLHGECGPFTDIWGLGAVVYCCLMGRPPHAGDSASDVLRRLMCDSVAPIDVQGVSKAVSATIDRALARDPHGRYPSMSAFLHALQMAATHDPSGVVTQPYEFPAPETDPPPVAQPQRRRARLQVQTLMTAAFFAAGLSLIARRPEGVRRVEGPLPPTNVSRIAPPDAVLTPQRSSSGDEAVLRARVSDSEPLSRQAAVTSMGTRHPPARPLPLRTSPAPVASASASVPDTRTHDDAEREATTGLPIITRW